MVQSLLPVSEKSLKRSNLPDLPGHKRIAPPSNPENPQDVAKPENSARRRSTPLVELIQGYRQETSFEGCPSSSKPKKEASGHSTIVFPSGQTSLPGSLRSPRGKNEDLLGYSNASGYSIQKPQLKKGGSFQRRHSIESKSTTTKTTEPMLLFSRRRRKSTGENTELNPVRPPGQSGSFKHESFKPDKPQTLPALPSRYDILGGSSSSIAPKKKIEVLSDSGSDFGGDSSDEDKRTLEIQSAPNLPIVPIRTTSRLDPGIENNNQVEGPISSCNLATDCVEPKDSSTHMYHAEKAKAAKKVLPRFSADVNDNDLPPEIADVAKVSDDSLIDDVQLIPDAGQEQVLGPENDEEIDDLKELPVDCRQPGSRPQSVTKVLTDSWDPFFSNRSAKSVFQDWTDSKDDLPEIAGSVTFSAMEQSVLRRYFEMHDDDNSGTLDFHELTNVIDDIGRKPQQGSEDEILLDQIWLSFDQNGDGQLNFSEFMDLFASYYKCIYQRLFNQLDDDKSGSISQEELWPLFKMLTSIGMGIPAEHAENLAMSADEDGSGTLDFFEFLNLMQQYRMIEFGQLRKTAGFPEDKVEWFQALFLQYDADGSGSLEIKEAAKLFDMGLCGQPLTDTAKFVELFARMDVDRSASLDFEEFLRLVRVWYKEQERNPSGSASPRASAPGSKDSVRTTSCKEEAGTQKRRMSLKMMSKASMSFSEDVLSQDQITALTDKTVEASFAHNIEDDLLSRQWGLLLPEIHALRESFQLVDIEGTGQINQAELNILLKLVDFAPSTKTQTKSLEDCLAKQDSKLDFKSVVIVFSNYHEALCEAATKMALAFVGEENGGLGSIPVEKVSLVMYGVGQFVTKADIQTMLSGVGLAADTASVDVATFSQMLEHRRRRKMEEWRLHCGFSEKDKANFREACFGSSSAPTRNVRIALEKVRGIIDQLGFKLDSEGQRGGLMLALTRIDVTGSGSISFEEFLLILRYLENHNLVGHKKEEELAARRLGLNHDALQAVKQIFSEMAAEVGSRGPRIEKVSVQNCKVLICHNFNLCKTQEHRKQLNQAIEEITTGQDDNLLTLPQFLCVLEKLPQLL